MRIVGGLLRYMLTSFKVSLIDALSDVAPDTTILELVNRKTIGVFPMSDTISLEMIDQVHISPMHKSWVFISMSDKCFPKPKTKRKTEISR